MYISHRAALVRNLGVATCNGAITLIILLIAPLGLTAVIINTLLVTLASFINAAAGDRIVRFLQPAQIKTIIAEIINQNSIIMNSSQQKQK
ncbi:CRISPR-associated protein Csx18 [Cuspidothrix issatschenkoi]|uniref:Uncharacterized protein n=1 Tax=Cuspidothrix issatschenkoi CHARLIE-1 TaxID=2052836 RepID=A0A2S6CSY8_9CYAN|nr:CRISPR-associated protein Csx18 [Cuspidothrix issatschenkoi]PPJ62839.1 hypothetical protein CUN59_13365 [Cuspidothrix issatschenkoi CHARLIE-1]